MKGFRSSARMGDDLAVCAGVFRGELPLRSTSHFSHSIVPCSFCPVAGAKCASRIVKTPWRVGICPSRSEEHTSELQSHLNLVCRLLLEKKKKLDYVINNTCVL